MQFFQEMVMSCQGYNALFLSGDILGKKDNKADKNEMMKWKAITNAQYLSFQLSQATVLNMAPIIFC